MASLPFPRRGAWAGVAVLRPLLEVPKARLIATLASPADRLSSAIRATPINASNACGCGGAASALDALGLTPEALALSARRLRRAREALDHAADNFLEGSSETSEAGYATVDQGALLKAPQEIALRALARLIASVGGGEEPLQLAKLEALLASLAKHPGTTQTLGRCRIEPLSGRLGIFREMRASGLPVIELLPGKRALWDNRFQDRASESTHRRRSRCRALGDPGCARSPRLASHRCRGLPGGLCLLVSGADVLAGIPMLESRLRPSFGPCLPRDICQRRPAGAVERGSL